MNLEQDEHILELIAQGFDDSEYDEEGEKWSVRCSQCQALVINGVPAHEFGCPNKRRNNDFNR